jgi:hypothetical protein
MDKLYEELSKYVGSTVCQTCCPTNSTLSTVAERTKSDAAICDADANAQLVVPPRSVLRMCANVQVLWANTYINTNVMNII